MERIDLELDGKDIDQGGSRALPKPVPKIEDDDSVVVREMRTGSLESPDRKQEEAPPAEKPKRSRRNRRTATPTKEESTPTATPTATPTHTPTPTQETEMNEIEMKKLMGEIAAEAAQATAAGFQSKIQELEAELAAALKNGGKAPAKATTPEWTYDEYSSKAGKAYVNIKLNGGRVANMVKEAFDADSVMDAFRNSTAAPLLEEGWDAYVDLRHGRRFVAQMPIADGDGPGNHGRC